MKKLFGILFLVVFLSGCAMRTVRMASGTPATSGGYERQPRRIAVPEYTPLMWLEEKRLAVVVTTGGWNNSIQAVLEDLFRGRGATVVALAGQYNSTPYFQSGSAPAVDFVAETRVEERNCGYYYYSTCVVASIRVIGSDNVVRATGIGEYRGHRGPYIVYGWNYYDDRYRAYAVAARAAVDSLR